MPAIVRVPDGVGSAQRGRTSQAFITLVDLMPTMFGLAGLPVPEPCEGIDFSRVVLDETDDPRGYALMQFEGNYMIGATPGEIWRAIRKPKWMYCVTLEVGPYQLFDMEDDPYQMHNLVDELSHQRTRTALHEQLVELALERQDDFFSRVRSAE